MHLAAVPAADLAAGPCPCAWSKEEELAGSDALCLCEQGLHDELAACVCAARAEADWVAVPGLEIGSGQASDLVIGSEARGPEARAVADRVAAPGLEIGSEAGDLVIGFEACVCAARAEADRVAVPGLEIGSGQAMNGPGQGASLAGHVCSLAAARHATVAAARHATVAAARHAPVAVLAAAHPGSPTTYLPPLRQSSNHSAAAAAAAAAAVVLGKVAVPWPCGQGLHWAHLALRAVRELLCEMLQRALMT